MKTQLLIGIALVISFNGYSQSNKKTVNPKFTQKMLTHQKGVLIEGQSSSHPNVNWRPTAPKTIASACVTGLHVSDSWNPNGVGAAEDAMDQNCLVYNKDLNTIAWIMRGSCDWTAAFPTSGGYEATIIQNVCGTSFNPVPQNTLDTVVLWTDIAANNFGGRFPGGSWLNPVGNKDWHQAYACVVGPYNALAQGNWLGANYVAKPLWSQSAVNHTAPPHADSLTSADGSTPFGPSHIGASLSFGVPNVDGQQIGNTMWSTGAYLDLGVTNNANNPGQQARCGFISNATIASHGVVNWTVDSMSLKPNFYKGTVGYLNIGTPRLAFGVDGQTGYAVFLGRLATTYGNSADSSITPIVFKTTNGGTNWIQVLAGYDWATQHPEVSKNVGMGVLSTQKATYYGFSSGYNGVDLTVDANNVLHFVATANEPYHGSPTTAGYVYSVDSIALYSYTYDYDNTNYHPIYWDFMTDGTTSYGWKTMMVDSLQSGVCNGSTADTTSNYSAWTSSGGKLSIGAHLTVSRSTDGKKIFYGWADTPAGVTGLVDGAGNTINPNLAPDIFVKGYDVTTNMLTATTDITPGLAAGFFPYLADYAYYDTTQAAWVTPAVYTIGRSYTNSSLGFVIYDGDGTDPAHGVNYFYTNCGSFTAGDFSIPATIYPYSIGINQVTNNNSQLSVYPNPTNGSFVVESSSTTKQTMHIYDINGKMVLSQNISGKTSIDAGNLNEGVYIISIISNEGVTNKRLVIVK